MQHVRAKSFSAECFLHLSPIVAKKTLLCNFYILIGCLINIFADEYVYPMEVEPPLHLSALGCKDASRVNQVMFHIRANINLDEKIERMQSTSDGLFRNLVPCSYFKHNEYTFTPETYLNSSQIALKNVENKKCNKVECDVTKLFSNEIIQKEELSEYVQNRQKTSVLQDLMSDYFVENDSNKLNDTVEKLFHFMKKLLRKSIADLTYAKGKGGSAVNFKSTMETDLNR